MDGQQHALAEVGERGVERRAVDRRVVAQQPLGELRRGRAGGAVVLDERGIDRQPVQREAAPRARARTRRRRSALISQRLFGVGCAMWPSSSACSLSMKLSGSALQSASTSPARASRTVATRRRSARMRDSSNVGSGPRARPARSSPQAASRRARRRACPRASRATIAHGSPPAIAICAGVRKRWRCVGERWRTPARTAVRSSGKGNTARYSSPSSASWGAWRRAPGAIRRLRGCSSSAPSRWRLWRRLVAGSAGRGPSSATQL